MLSAQVKQIPWGSATCHAATWFWAAREAQAPSQSAHTEQDTLLKIAGIESQPKILALPRAGSWYLGITPMLPPPNTVLLWTAPPTHSAIVTVYNGKLAIVGYNQDCVFTAPKGFGVSGGQPSELKPDCKRCNTISERTIVNAAGTVGFVSAVFRE